MKYLVFCSCGHSLEQHGQDGCSGSPGCGCPRDPGLALEAAIDDVRSRPWTMPDGVIQANEVSS